MLIERKKEILKTLDKNYVMIRDADGELLCLLGRDEEGYFVYSWEEIRFTKAQAEALLDKAAWVAITPVVDERIYNQYKGQIEDDYFQEE